jgi:paraquat-inducible protein A
MTPSDVRNLTIGCLALTVAGIILPCMTIVPHAGQYTGFIKLLAPDAFDSITFSLLGGIFKMMQSELLIGMLLLLFSVMFPMWKISTYIYYLYRTSKTPSRSMAIALKLGKYSMLDVFVLAVLVIAVKGLPGGSKVILEQGIYFFGASIILSLFIGQLITKVKPLSIESP